MLLDGQREHQNAKIELSGKTVHWPKYLFMTLELALILFSIYSFEIEREQGLLTILPLIFVGFVLSLVLRARYRLPMLLILSFISLFALLGAKHGALVVGIGMTLVLICHLPISFSLRVLIITLAGAFLASIRAGWIPFSWGSAVIPTLGSIFMFRLLLYLHDLKQKAPQPASIWHRLCYFFLLPNSCFLLFPVIDYRTFVKSYETDDRTSAMQQGMIWMFMGLAQMLVYRIIYFYWIPVPSEVVNARTLAVHLITGYALLLRICGQFTLSVGIICIFGFRLPPNFHNYYLATGFSDFWRRTNIYWKDFLTKLYYYPLYFRFRKWGIATATVISLLLVFFVTWLLHSYQFFWLKGKFPVSSVDALFWGSFAVAVVLDSLLQLNSTNKKSLGTRNWNFRSACMRSCKWLLFFTTMCILWSLWSSASVTEWIHTMATLQRIRLFEIGATVIILVFLVVAGSLFQRLASGLTLFPEKRFYRSASSVVVILLALLGIRFFVTGQSHLAVFVENIREPRLNRRDQQVSLKGYYEPLMGREQFITHFQEGKIEQGDDQTEPNDSGSLIPTNDLRISTFAPSHSFTTKGSEIRTNQWGMRDKEYSLVKPPNTYRFAILGSSVELGVGVRFEENFESLLENRLNELDGKNRKYEILNFSRSGYSVVENTVVCEKEALMFQPDAVLLFIHGAEEQRILNNLFKAMHKGIDLQELGKYLPEAAINGTTDFYEFNRQIVPHLDGIENWALKKIAADVLKVHAIPVCLYMEPDKLSGNRTGLWPKVAMENGFIFLNVGSALVGGDELFLSPYDQHLSVKGHRLVADYLYQQILSHQKDLGLSLKEK